MKKIYVAIMGLGTVGKGTYDNITDARDRIARDHGLDIEVKLVLDRDESRFACLPCGVGTTRVDDIINDPDISIVVETMGGVEPAGTFIKRAFASGKSVVSANKELIAKRWAELQDCAEQNGVGFYFEASCVGAVPVIRVLNESIQGDKINALYGIVNGTTNYILTKMSKDGLDYNDALAQAQQLGYAEFDPTADVEGYDAGYKISILGTMAFKERVCFDREYCTGITGITKQQMDWLAAAGYTVRLIASAKSSDSGVIAGVRPMAVRNSHMLASVEGAMNAVYLSCEHAGDMMLYGYGAGSRQTGSAILSDIVYCAEKVRHIYYNLKEKENACADTRASGSFACLTVVQNPDFELIERVWGSCLYEKHDLGDYAVIVTQPLKYFAWEALDAEFSEETAATDMKIVCQFEALV